MVPFFFYRVRVPNGISMVITSMQLVQMVVGCLVNLGVYNLKQSGLECNVSDRNIKLSFLMYTSYFVLFGHFFYDKYIAKATGKATVSMKAAADSKDANGNAANGHTQNGFAAKTAPVEREEKKQR